MNPFQAQFDVINYFPCEKGFFTPPRVFHYPYLLYVHSGKGDYKIGQKRYSCVQGDLFFCRKGEENTIFADKDDPFILSGLEFTVNDDAFLNENLSVKVNISEEKFARSCLEKMIEEYLYDRIYGKVICTNLLNAFLYEIIRLQTQSFSVVKKTAEQQAVLEYIASNINEKLSCKLLSEVFHYHKNTINRMIRKSTGCSFKEYVISLKIKEAKKYLLFTDKSVEEISNALGYSSSAFFCLQFKERTGKTPAVFRKQSDFSL